MRLKTHDNEQSSFTIFCCSCLQLVIEAKRQASEAIIKPAIQKSELLKTKFCKQKDSGCFWQKYSSQQ